jgi:3-carboxy-cis,cis-muconate cycloisomerase
VPVLPWHTDRSRILAVAAACAGASAALAKIARDVTLLAQSEVGEVREGGGPGGERRGGSSAMPHKQNPVAAIAVLGCTRRVPGLVATLIAAGEQEHQRAAGAWHAEWETFADLLRVTGSAASWGADLTGGLVVDPARMRANLAASHGLPLAERVSGLLAPALGRSAAHDLVARASADAAAVGGTLRESLLGEPELASRVHGAGITGAQIDAALDPAGYLGSAAAFTDAALDAHARRSLPAG